MLRIFIIAAAALFLCAASSPRADYTAELTRFHTLVDGLLRNGQMNDYQQAENVYHQTASALRASGDYETATSTLKSFRCQKTKC